MADFAALPLFTDSWLADTAHLERAERGLYMDLLILMWRSPGCRVPNDPAWIARKLRMADGEGATLAGLIGEFCQCDGNWITQKRLTKEHEYVSEKRTKQRERAKLRWNKEKEVCQGNAAPHASGNAPSPSPSPSPTVEDSPPFNSPLKGGARIQATDLAEWIPGEQDRLYAEDHNLDPDRILADIRDWAANAPASKRRKRAPSQFWQTWCRREADRRPALRPNGTGPPGLVATTNKLIRQFQERTNGAFRDDDAGTGEAQGGDTPALAGPARS